MPINKPHREFHAVDMATGWSTPPGYPAGIEQKILAGTLDEAGKSGSRTRLLRFAPEVFTTAPFVHDYWEEVYILAGDLTDTRLSAAFSAGMYACRPPGMVHGPCRTESGVLMLEVRHARSV